MKEEILQCAKDLFGSGFEFRPSQLEVIESIVSNILNRTKTQILDAPTGSGKSIIAIIVAEYLWKYHQKTSYILVSDLSLFQQYIMDIEKYKLTDIGFIQGLSQYTCDVNGLPIKCGLCKIAMVSVHKLINCKKTRIDYQCANKCEYVKNTEKATKSPITLMTYQMYLIQRNTIRKVLGEGGCKYKLRDLTICDECHKLPEIIQSKYSPVIEVDLPNWFITLNEYCEEVGYPKFNEKELLDVSGLIYKSNDQKIIYEGLKNYRMLLEGYLVLQYSISEGMKEVDWKDKSENNMEIIKYYRRLLRAIEYVSELHETLTNYFDIVRNDEHHEKCIVKTNDDFNRRFTINCIYESALINKFFHDKKITGSELLMSATIGNTDVFRKIIGCDIMKNEDYVVHKLPSTFNYENSPIVVIGENRMSYKEKAISIPNVAKLTEEICNLHKDERGIIQTGSYDIMNSLLKLISEKTKSRILSYKNADEKRISIEKFIKSSNGILIGPSLLEGLDFSGDLCRFVICAKMPYASLASNFIKEKMKLIPEWYSYDCISKLLQGFGRGVRFNGDYCINYILDACFYDLLARNSNDFPDYITERFMRD